ncbi:MAG: ABC transporter substrate-binding protein, partial [Hydrogenophaga sp.]|nr:ABC transporter substrate-binding protein [Hydrogenophaga sp.]
MPHPTDHLSRRQLLLAAGAVSLSPAWAQSGWPAIEQAARGQTVFWNAWAGSEQTNAYLQWVAQQVQASFGVKLQHVKITDTADVVKRVRAEKAAGRKEAEGTVDLVWINGENFAAMKREGLL